MSKANPAAAKHSRDGGVTTRVRTTPTAEAAKTELERDHPKGSRARKSPVVPADRPAAPARPAASRAGMADRRDNVRHLRAPSARFADDDQWSAPPLRGKSARHHDMGGVVPTLDDPMRVEHHHPNDARGLEFTVDPGAADAAADLAGDLGAQFLEGATLVEDMSERAILDADAAEDELPFVVDGPLDDTIEDDLITAEPGARDASSEARARIEDAEADEDDEDDEDDERAFDDELDDEERDDDEDDEERADDDDDDDDDRDDAGQLPGGGAEITDDDLIGGGVSQATRRRARGGRA